jgi:hypothetical protein
LTPFIRSLACVTAGFFLLTVPPVWSQSNDLQDEIKIDHRYTNVDAQSLIGLPMGSHKTTVDKNGSLKWSQWSLKRKPLDVPIGFSSQMDGALMIDPSVEASAGTVALKTASQTLYQGRYPFIVSKLTAAGTDVRLEELAFSVDPEADVSVLPTAKSGTRGLDMLRLTFTNDGATAQKVLLKLSGRGRNLPGHVVGDALLTGAGEDVVIVSDTGRAVLSREDNGFTLALRAAIPAHESKAIWLKLPYEWSAARNSELSILSGDALLAKAVAQWDGIWNRGGRVRYPQQVLNDFFDSSLAYVLILTEYDAKGDLWALDGPDVYRQYWGRGEYFQARALEVAGLLSPARESVEHAFNIINDDGEWDGPPTSGWPAWDNIGGNAGATWDYYLYTRDKAWLAKAYPFLLRSSVWVRDHREETTVEDVSGIPVGARPIRRMVTGSKCRAEPTPELKPGEKTYWYGLLPWSYGDSGLPEGHSYSHNFLAAYGIRVTADAARVLGKTEDAAWLDKEYGDFDAAIRASVERSVKLEKTAVPYLPAQPTRPDAAYSQTFLAIWPTGLYGPNDPLVSGLLSKLESEESQGLPTNVAWAGPAGVWPGESMNMSETYLLRDDAQKNAGILVAALNHSYTTNVFKEEILTDITKDRACDTPHSNRQNGQGTGDMPEAWGNANVVNLLRDMLVQERMQVLPSHESKTTLHLLSGLPAEWIGKTGETVSVDRTPTTLGTVVSLKLTRTSPTMLHLELDTGSRVSDTFVHVPLPVGSKISEAKIDDRAVPASAISLSANGRQAIVAVGAISHPARFDFTLASTGASR